MRLRHKMSGEEITDFPHWIKINGMYGYIVPVMNSVLMFVPDNTTGIAYEDVTDLFDNPKILETAREMYADGLQMKTIKYLQDSLNLTPKEAYDYFNKHVRGMGI